MLLRSTRRAEEPRIPTALLGSRGPPALGQALLKPSKKEDGLAMAARRPPFVPPVTLSRSRRRAAGRADPLVSRPTVPNRAALSGDYFLLARRDEIAQLPLLHWVRPAGVVLHPTCGEHLQSCGGL